MKRNINPLWIMLLLICTSSFWLYVLMLVSNKQDTEKNKEKDKFYQTEFKAILLEKTFKHGIESIRTDQYPQQFKFRPIITSEGFFFHAQTDIGDSIIKPAFNDTIIVKSNDKIYRYRFDKLTIPTKH